VADIARRWTGLETGYYHNGFRDYDPSLGRYLESDPIGLLGGLNTYSYAGGNPINRIDPLALYDCPCRGIPGSPGPSPKGPPRTTPLLQALRALGLSTAEYGVHKGLEAWAEAADEASREVESPAPWNGFGMYSEELALTNWTPMVGRLGIGLSAASILHTVWETRQG
jgi:RHS repeat-associated protein